MQCSSGEFSVLTFSLLFAHFDSLVNPLKLGFHAFQSTTEVFIKSHQPNIARSNSSQIFFLIPQYHFDIIKYSLLFEVISSLGFLDTTGNLFFAVFWVPQDSVIFASMSVLLLTSFNSLGFENLLFATGSQISISSRDCPLNSPDLYNVCLPISSP